MIESHGIIFSAKSAVSAKPKPQPSPTIIKNRKYPSANRRLSVTKMNGAVISSICLLNSQGPKPAAGGNRPGVSLRPHSCCRPRLAIEEEHYFTLCIYESAVQQLNVAPLSPGLQYRRTLSDARGLHGLKFKTYALLYRYNNLWSLFLTADRQIVFISNTEN